MRYTKVGILAILCLIGLAANDSPAVKNIVARDAIQKRYALAHRAEQEYRAKLALADKQLVTSLDQAVREAMAGNDLNQATALNALKKQAAEHLAAEQSPTIGPAIGGTKWNWLENTDTVITFQPDGALTCKSWRSAGEWKAVDDSTVDVMQPDKLFLRVTFTTDLQYSLWVQISPSHTLYTASRQADAP
jgi:hypothetical protein